MKRAAKRPLTRHLDRVRMLGERTRVRGTRATPNADFEAIRARATAGERTRGSRWLKTPSVRAVTRQQAAYAAPVALTPQLSCEPSGAIPKTRS